MKTGSPYPLGATVTATGVNFSVFSYHATRAELLLFDTDDATQPRHTVDLVPGTSRTSHYWHVHLPGIAAGQLYGYKMSGPYAPELGHRFDPEKLLLDPYARAISSKSYQRSAAASSGNNAGAAAMSVVADLSGYDWEGDRPLDHPFSGTVLYEVHIGGFTRNPNSGIGEEKRGTYAGLIEKIPYLKDLGITAVELMPVFQFDTQDAPTGLENYWGYSPMSFFAPHGGYSSRGDPLGCLDEFRDMVKALHKAGIEVILDVVYNHTAEGGDAGPTFSFKGLDNRFYYLLSDDFSQYADHTGTGNTLNSNFAVMIEIPAGPATLGRRRGEGFGWDNEFEQQEVEVPAFGIAQHKVTNGDYLEFVKARRGTAFLDLPRGRMVLSRHVRRYSTAARLAGLRVVRPGPVLCAVERQIAADRGAVPSRGVRWRTGPGWIRGRECGLPALGSGAGHRIATESLRRFANGGNGWEWTRTRFEPFPGFHPFSFYPGYSANFFDGQHYVLKGGSPRTARCLLRSSFRNWFRPAYPYIYATFRLLED